MARHAPNPESIFGKINVSSQFIWPLPAFTQKFHSLGARQESLAPALLLGHHHYYVYHDRRRVSPQINK